MFAKRKQESVSFAINVTPEKRHKLDEGEVVAVLAPFNAFPKVCFESIKLHSSVNKDIILKNPSKNALQIELIKYPDSTRGYHWSFTSCELPRESEQTLRISWKPSEYGSWRDNVKVVNKKNNKAICEIILLSSTEDPPKVTGRHIRSQFQHGSKLKRPIKLVTNKHSEDKENNLFVVPKESYNQHSEIPANADSFGNSNLLLDKQQNRATFSSVVPSENPTTIQQTPRRVTYEVLTPVSTTRRSTYCLRNNPFKSITDLEHERLTFEQTAGPGVHNESLEKAASKLVEKGICIYQNSAASATFTIPTTSSQEIYNMCTPEKRKTYELMAPVATVTRPTNAQINVGTLTEQSNQLIERFSLDSLNEGLEDILEDKKTESTSSENQIPNLDFDNINFDRISINSHKDNEDLIQNSFQKRSDTSCDLIFKPKVNGSASEEKICNLSPMIHCAKTETGLDNKPLNILFQPQNLEHFINNEVLPSDKVGFYHDVPDSFANLNFKISPIKNNAYQSQNEVYAFNNIKTETTHLEDKMAFHKLSFDSQILKQITDNISNINQPCSEINCTRNNINTEDVILKSAEFDLKTEMNDMNKITPSNSFVESGDSLVKVRSSTPVNSSLYSDLLSNHPGKLDPKALLWDISPPKKCDLREISSKDSCLVSTNKKRSAAMKAFVQSQFKDVNILPSKNKIDSKTKSKMVPLTNSTFSTKNVNKTNVSQKSENIFSMPPTTLKRQFSTCKPANTSPPVRKKVQDVKVKRLSTPIIKKPTPRSFSDIRKQPKVDVTQNDSSRSCKSSKSQKSVRVTEWLPVRKLRLFSTSNKDSTGSSSSIDTPLELGSPDPFLATTTLNPFSEGQLYYSEEWLRGQEQDLIAWAHLMLQPPAELQLDRDHTAHSTLHRLNALRMTAFKLLVSPQVAEILVKVKSAIEKRVICIRQDRQLHADLGLQETVLNLLMCYNPLWLRLCLEAVYQCTIHLKRHSDTSGLINFIRKRVISDECIMQTYSHPTIPYLMMPEFEDKMKKFTLYKFLVLVYLLDLVKSKKVILHDPCLFRKDSKFKSSREILVEFNKEFIAGAGDITKMLRVRGFEVSHCQTYLHEFDFSLSSTAELRDGIRITKLVEILIGDNSLCSKLRVPAISSLQKKFNAEVAFNALKKAGYVLPEEIAPKNISDGHKEKTLSFLWYLRGIVQKRAVHLIIIKWREMKLFKKDRNHFLLLRSSAIKIQRWYRRIKYFSRNKNEVEKAKNQRESFLKLRSSAIVIQRRFRQIIKNKNEIKKTKAVFLIQNWYRSKMNYRKGKYPFKIIQTATITIQRAYRKYRQKKVALLSEERKHLISLKNATIFVQAVFRANICMKRERHIFIEKKSAAIILQRAYIAYCIGKKERILFKKLKWATLVIQRRFRAICLGKKERQQFLKYKAAAIIVQQRYRSYILGHKERTTYLLQKRAVAVIQTRYNAYITGRKQRQLFLEFKTAVLVIQRRYKANSIMKSERESYLKERTLIIKMQKRIRNKLLTIKTRKHFVNLKAAALVLQRAYRNKLLARKTRNMFLEIKAATVFVQRIYRSKLLARQDRERFLKTKAATLVLQRRYKATLLANNTKERFLKLKAATSLVQKRYRETLLARKNREMFLKIKTSVVVIQRKYRAVLLERQDRGRFLKMKEAVLVIQRKYRATQLARQDRGRFLKMKKAVLVIQRKYRAILLGGQDREKFLKMKEAALVIQRKYRTIQLARQDRGRFLKMKKAVLIIQRKYRATQLARQYRERFLKMRQSAMVLQRKYRASILGKQDREMFLKMKEAALVIQRKYRASIFARQDRNKFVKMKASVLVLQRKYRASQLARQDRERFLKIKAATLVLQRRYKATLLANNTKERFLKLKAATSLVQKRYRETLLARKNREMFLKIKTSVVVIQRKYRAVLLERKDRGRFLKMKEAVLVIQRKYRATQLARQDRGRFLKMKEAVLVIQRKYRAILLGGQDRERFLKMKEAALVIQRKYRTIQLARQDRGRFLKMKEAVLIIQRKYRATQLARQYRKRFLKMRQSAMVLQRNYRASIRARNDRRRFLKMKEAALVIRRKYRAILLARQDRERFLKIKEAALAIQRKYRARLLARKDRETFFKMKQASLVLQRKDIGKLLANTNSQDKLLQEKINAAVKIQAAWRGKMVRKKVVIPSPQITPTDTDMFQQTINNRGCCILPALRDFSKYSVAELLKILYNLDVLTKLSPNQCEYFVCNGAVRVLYALLPSANKALGTDRCIELALLILANLYKAPNTSSTVWKETLEANGTVQLVELMLNFRLEKTSTVFCKAATLIWLFAQDSEHVKIISSNPKIKKMLDYIIKTMGKVSAPFPCSSKQSKSSAPKKLPPVKPDWGNYFNLHRAFEDKSYAIDRVKKALKL